MLEKALEGSKKYWAWVAFLGIFALTGTYWYIRQFNEGLGLTGLHRDVSWGLYIGQFTFLVGVAASASMKGTADRARNRGLPRKSKRANKYAGGRPRRMVRSVDSGLIKRKA